MELDTFAPMRERDQAEVNAFAAYARLRGDYAEHPKYHGRLWETLEPELRKLLVAMWLEGTLSVGEKPVA